MSMETTVFGVDGKESGTFTLPESVFDVKWNPDLVHEVVVAMQGNARQGNAHTKDRSEVKATTAKPWKQKGTGRARHGSRVSNIWKGGGVSHGPRSEKDYSRKINKKARAKALASTLSKKHADGEVLFVDTFSFEAPKAADAKAAMAAIAKGADKASLTTKRNNAALVVLAKRNEVAEKSFRNFGNYEVKVAKDINPVDLLTYKFVVIAEPSESVATLESRVAKVTATK